MVEALTDTVNTLSDNADDELRPMQRLFADTYLANGNNGLQAAIAAGYSPASAGAQACDLLKRPHVRAYMDLRMRAIAAEMGVTDQTIMAGLLREAGLSADEAPPLPGSNGASRVAALRALMATKYINVLADDVAGQSGEITINISRSPRPGMTAGASPVADGDTAP